MHILVPLAMLSAVLSVHIAAQSPSGPPAYSGYHLVWPDDFDGTALDTKQLSSQTPGNVEVKDSMLVIHLRKQDLNEKEYTGGGIISKVAFKYGFYEARLGIDAASGWHSSFWVQRYNGADTKPKGDPPALPGWQ